MFMRMTNFRFDSKLLLKRQPFSLQKDAEEIETNINYLVWFSLALSMKLNERVEQCKKWLDSQRKSAKRLITFLLLLSHTLPFLQNSKDEKRLDKELESETNVDNLFAMRKKF